MINTIHAECGTVTVAALVKLLERLSPGVVFAEIPKAHAARFMSGDHGNLESRAVAEVRQRRPLAVIPVDRDEPGEDFFRVTRELFDLVERRSRDYRNLVDHDTAQAARGGFRYLNSAESAAAVSAIRTEVRDTIDWIRAPELHAVYDQWLDEIELRDQEMVANIVQFAATSESPSGVFLVGAAHRQSIIEKVRSGRRAGSSAVEWQVELPSDLFE